MKDDRENNGDPDILINHLLSRDQSTEKGAGQLDIRHIRERFLNALKEISHLEKVLEEKNTQLAVASKEKDRLLHALNKAFGEKKRLHDRLADFDVLRNMEIVEFKQSSEKIIGEINRLRKENSEMLDDVFEKDAMLDRKELKIRDVQDDLYTAVEVLRKTESRYKEIEQERDSLNERLKDMERRNTENSGRLEEYGKLLDNADFEKDAVARERDSLSEKLNMTVHDLTGKLEAEYQGRIEVLNNTITDLRTGLEKDLQLKNEMIAGLESRYETDMKKASLRIDRLTAGKAEVGNEKINENASLKNEIALLNSLLDEKKKEGDRLQNGGQGKFDGISGKERDTHGNLYYYLSLLLAIFIIVITGLWLYTGIEVEKLYSETDEVNMELQQKAIPPPPVPAAISAGEDILNAMEKSPELASVISGILAEVPEDVRISSIELSEIRGGKNGKIINEINIKGFSTTEPEIADIVSTLKASRRFYDIEIASSQKTGKNIFFELKAKLR